MICNPWVCEIKGCKYLFSVYHKVSKHPVLTYVCVPILQIIYLNYDLFAGLPLEAVRELVFPWEEICSWGQRPSQVKQEELHVWDLVHFFTSYILTDSALFK